MSKQGERMEITSTEGLTCPFCGVSDFDLIGLKIHIASGWCDVFNSTPMDFEIENDKDQALPPSAGSDALPCAHCGREYRITDLLSVAGQPWCDPCAWKVWRDDTFPKFVIPNASLSIPGGEPGYAPGDCWAIMVNPDYVNGRGQWSRANQRGYTMDWREAGRFSRQEAEETAAGSHGKYTAVPLADISEPNASVSIPGGKPGYAPGDCSLSDADRLVWLRQNVSGLEMRRIGICMDNTGDTEEFRKRINEIIIANASLSGNGKQEGDQ